MTPYLPPIERMRRNESLKKFFSGTWLDLATILACAAAMLYFYPRFAIFLAR